MIPIVTSGQVPLSVVAGSDPALRDVTGIEVSGL